MTTAVHFKVDGGEARLGRLDGNVIIDAGAAPQSGFVPTAEAWALVNAAEGQTYPLDAVELLPPVLPGKILAVGLNYRSHVEETKLKHPDVPMMFSKFPSSITGPFDEIVVPREETRPDYEGEVGIIISRRGYRISKEDAWDYVGGFTAVNDVSGRRAQLETPMKQFTLGKSFDTFTPIGPGIVSPDSVDLDALTVQTKLDGELMQDGHFRDLIFDVPTLLEYLSRGVTLEPGDLIPTGTPGGVGDERKPPRYLTDGSTVEVIIGGVGTIRNAVRLEN
ncbi:fumarylacetoacetate hydrolase family protein [Paenarthrobacter aromaticivorans]|uniref:fumarylacetoacetate hydrolase family protein n=1 Tax=Paenarthrobacter aromaticivorans TaxID=2849150 RepID=UPI003A8017C7